MESKEYSQAIEMDIFDIAFIPYSIVDAYKEAKEENNDK